MALQVASDSSLPAGAKSVALFLISYMNSVTKKAFPSVNTLAQVTGLNRSTVNRALKKLRERGHFERVEKGGGSGRGSATHTSVYVPILKRAAAPLLNSSRNDLTVASALHNSGSDASLRVASTPPEPKKEPKKEPVKLKLSKNGKCSLFSETQIVGGFH